MHRGAVYRSLLRDLRNREGRRGRDADGVPPGVHRVQARQPTRAPARVGCSRSPTTFAAGASARASANLLPNAERLLTSVRVGGAGAVAAFAAVAVARAESAAPSPAHPGHARPVLADR